MVLFVNETKGKPSDCRAAQAPAQPLHSSAVSEIKGCSWGSRSEA